ncbi:beta-3 adrenergic receptor-like [Patiria miniata]|uniref:G-protein coupled receptors family 1 profile domain-containing protein n=1 Tax=Patiria miniata TaxID=46514 RepID=A0A914AY59_PATMI|nr:beta-3 adrenergic receptor-like [Patiria miniata]
MASVRPASADNVSSVLSVYDSYAEKQLLAALYSLISIAGVLGNSSVLLAVVLSRKPRTTTNVFVVNLAVADLFTCLSLPIMVLAVLSENRERLLVSHSLCALQGFTAIVCIGCSLNNIASIAVYRALITRRKSRGDRVWLCNHYRLAAMVALTWLIPLVVGLLPIVSEFGSYEYDDKLSTCSFNPTAQGSGTFSKITVSLYYPLQVLCILTSYASIFFKVRRQGRRVNVIPNQPLAVVGGVMRLPARPGTPRQPHLPADEPPPANNHLSVSTANNPVPRGSSPSSSASHATREQPANRRHLSRRSVGITRSLFLVVLVFFVLVAPYFVTVSVISDISKKFIPFLGMICVSNSCMNPMIYASRHPDFKTVIRCIVLCRLSKIPMKSSLLRRVLSSRG